MRAAGLLESRGPRRFARSSASCVKLLIPHNLVCRDKRSILPGQGKLGPSRAAVVLLAGWLVGRDGQGLNPAWPGGEQGLFH